MDCIMSISLASCRRWLRAPCSGAVLLVSLLACGQLMPLPLTIGWS
ncbi:MAG: hypothetical protein RL695_1634 [Pseudomonadota bacterium]